MSDEDEQFQQRWGFRRNDSDVDSSSNEQSRPSSVSDQKPKRNPAKTMHSPQSHPGDENHTSDEELDKEPNKSCKKQVRKFKTRRTDEPFNGASVDLSQHMESLVEDVKVARQGLLKWMNDELEKSFKDDKISQPAVPKKNQRQVTKRSTVPRNNPNKARRRTGTNTRKPEGRSSEKLVKESKTSNETSEVIVSGNEPAENVAASGTVPAEKNQKPKGKRLGVSSKKQKIAAGDQQTDKAGNKAPASASASNYLTLPAVLPRQEPENSERTNSEGGIGERDMRSRNGLLSSQLNFQRSQQKDGIFSQNYPRNVSDYEQMGAPTIGNIRGTAGNGNGGGFPFGLQSQGLNGGIGMPNFPGQFGLQYLSQESILSGLRMNGGHPILPNGNHAFSENYGAYNQQLRYKAQGGLMPTHSPDNIRAGNLQQPR